MLRHYETFEQNPLESRHTVIPAHLQDQYWTMFQQKLADWEMSLLSMVSRRLQPHILLGLLSASRRIVRHLHLGEY